MCAALDREHQIRDAGSHALGLEPGAGNWIACATVRNREQRELWQAITCVRKPPPADDRALGSMFARYKFVAHTPHLLRPLWRVDDLRWPAIAVHGVNVSIARPRLCKLIAAGFGEATHFFAAICGDFQDKPLVFQVGRA